MHVSEAEERLSVPQSHGLIQISSKLVDIGHHPHLRVTFTVQHRLAQTHTKDAESIFRKDKANVCGDNEVAPTGLVRKHSPL